MAEVSNNPIYQSTDNRKTVRLPLFGNHFNRDATTNKDQRYINCFPETSKNTVTDLKKFYLVKRPGTVLQSSTGVTGEGRGIWYWNGYIYAVVGSKLLRGATVVATLNTSTGMCGATTILNPTEAFFICDGIDGYVINKDNSIENVEKAMLRWTASTVLEIGDRRIPTASNGYFYTATEGTTGVTEPTWPTTIGSTVISGTVTFTCTGTYSGAVKWTNRSYAVGDLVTPVVENGMYYEVTVTDGASGVTEPTWPTVYGETVELDGVTYECKGYYGGFPSPHVPTPVVLDGYLCLAELNSIDMYNSASTNVFSWNSLDFTSAESFSDPIRGLARQNNYVIAYGDVSTEMFYNSANETGSPFSRNESFLLQVGLLSHTTIMQTEKMCMWVGKSDAGKTAVWMLDGFSPKEISTEYIERIINSETSTVYAYGLRVAGHFFYILNLPTINKTLVYDIEENLWHEWSYSGNTTTPFNYFTPYNNKVLLLHKNNGNIYELSESVYKDFDSNITTSIVTTKYDFESNKRKFIYRTEIVGDLVDSNISLYWSDDDYQTWSNEKVLNLIARPYFMRGGATRRRAFKLEHTEDTPLRLEFIELKYTVGEH